MVRDDLDLPLKQKAVIIFDMFRAHLSDDFMNYIKSKALLPVLVPPNCTDRLQPMDLSVQKHVKDFMKGCFQKWYTDQILSQKHDGDTGIQPVPLHLSVIKPLHLKWLVQCYEHFQRNKDLVRNGFKEAGIDF